jgi:hypothetical protein
VKERYSYAVCGDMAIEKDSTQPQKWLSKKAFD